MTRPPSTKVCARCRSWDDCSGKPWYSIPDIRYCRHQVLWIIGHLVTCTSDKPVALSDRWPVEEKDSGYTEAPATSHSVKAHAPYERTLQVIGDITGRLKKTGKDGRLLILEVHSEVPLSQDARNALNYVCGWREKHMSYSRWLKQRVHRVKMNTKKYSSSGAA